MNRSWNELTKEEKEGMIKKWEELRKNGYSYFKIKEETEKNYKIKVSRQTIFRELNPEKKKLYRDWEILKRNEELNFLRKKKDYILQEVKREFDKNLSEEEIVRRLSEDLLSLPPYLIRWTVNGLLQLLKNPETSLRKALPIYQLKTLYLMGMGYIRKVYNLGPKDKELIKSALEKGPLTTSEIKKMKKGKSQPSLIIQHLKKDPKYKLNISSIHLPFSGNQYVYFLEEHRDKAIKRVKDETLKKLDCFVSYLKKYKFDEKGKEALLNILFKPYVSEDDENIQLLRKYKGVFNCLQAHILKCIEFNGKKYYSFWYYQKN